MIMKFIKRSVLLCAVLSTFAYADTNDDWIDGYLSPEPIESVEGIKNNTVHYSKETPVIILEPLDKSKEALQDRAYKARDASTLGVPLNAGVKRTVTATETVEKFYSTLDWETLVDGSHIAALSIISPQAEGNRFILDVESIDPRAELRFIDNSTDEVFTVSGEEIINTIFINKQTSEDTDANSNLYVGPYLTGEQATLEIFLPKAVAIDSIKISLPYLSHIFLSPTESNVFESRTDPQSCMVNVGCDSNWDRVSKGIARMLFTDAAGSSFLCTGTLMNDRHTSLIPYFLTANHCIDSQVKASSLQTFWFYKTTSCSSSTLNPDYKKLTGGADVLYKTATTDTSFLRLRNKPPAGVNFQGSWAIDARNQQVAAVHHPGGAPQKISKGSTRATLIECTTSTTFSCKDSSNVNAGYYSVIWNSGATLGGSSGGGLFLTNPGNDGSLYLVGQLYGGSSSCENPNGRDVYGRYDLAYKAGISTYLNANAPTPVVGRTPIFRFYNTKLGTHFFTGSVKERDSIIANSRTFTYEGQAFFAYPKTGTSLSPVYRFFHKVRGSHFYTISKSEKENIERKYPNYIYEGISWYAAQNSASGTTPLYRFYNKRTGTHFYTVSAAEKNNIINKYPSFVYEGIAYHVWTKK